MMNFSLYSKYYDLLYSNKDYESESNYVLNILKNFSNSPITSILELGGGTGKHAQFFTKSNIDVFGVELSSKMIDLAEELNLDRYTIKQGDIRHNHYIGNQFDCAVSLFHVISYLNTNEDVIACFNSVNQQLKSGGLFVFDVWFTPAVYNLKPESRIKKMENNEISVTRIAQSMIDYQNSIVHVNYSIFVEDLDTKEYFKFEETHAMRHFTINEIKLIASLSGFEIIKTEEFLSEKSPTNETWGCIFILRKK